MNEELLIKLKVDTSSVTTSINKVKNEVSNVNKTIAATSSSSSATKQTSEQANKATGQLSQNVQKLVQGLQKLKNIGSLTDVLEIGAELGAAAAQTKVVTKSMEQVEKQTEDVVNDTKKWVAELREALALSQANGGTTRTYAAGGKGGGSILDVDDAGTSERLLAKYGDTMGDVADDAVNLADNVDDVAVATGAAGTAASGTGGALAGLGATMGSVMAIAAALIPVFIMVGTVIAGVGAALRRSKIGDEIYHTAHQFGFSTDAFQEWSYIMERSGGTIEDLSGFLETLGSEQAAVITGSEEAAQKFKNLGISAEEAASMDSQQLFETTISKLQGIKNETERAAYAYELFGDEASRLMNVINMSNGEMQEAINQYKLLGGAMSGELVENSNRLQNSIANMKQAWQGISNTLAEVFIPIVQKVVNWLTKAFVWVNLFLRTIFGLDLTPAAQSADKAANSTKKYTGGVKAATKAAEELKRTTMGFDELNIVSDPNKGAGANTGAGASGFDMSGMPSLDSSLLNMEDLNLDSMYAWFEKYKGLIAQITTWSLLLIGIILAVIGICAVNVPLAILGIGMAGLGIAIGISSGAFGEAWEAIKNAISKACDAIGEVVKAVAEAIGNFFSTVWDGIVWVGEKIGEFFTYLFSLPGKAFEFGQELGAKIKDSISAKLAELKESLSNWWGGVKNWYGSTIKPIFTKEYWANKFEQMKKGVSEKLDQVGEKFSTMWKNVKSGAKGALDGIKNTFTSIPTWFKDKFTQAWTNVKNVFSKGGKIFDGIKDGIASAFKTIVNGLIGGINKVIKKPFDAINGMLNSIRDVNILGVEPFKGFWKHNPISVPQIPKLAKGGLITGSVLANIGEAGNELVLPLEQNTAWMDTLADKIAARNGGPSKIVLQVGEKELGWATINSINNITKQTGALQLSL